MTSLSKARVAALGIVILSQAPSALAQSQGSDGCQDTWPEERERPSFEEHFALTGTSGHATELIIKIKHLPGESVFPAGLQFAPDAPEVALLENASFYLPASSSDVKPQLKRTVVGENGETIVTLPVIPLPKEAGRKELTLPRLPIAVARASGQVHTICSQPHVMTVEDPLTSAVNPEPQKDPGGRPQIEVWTTMRDIVYGLLIAIPLAIVLAWLYAKFLRREKKKPAPPPPRPPWETAFAQLEALKRRGLLDTEQYEEFLDEVCDTLRRYLGERYGFDGLESTTRELLRQLSTRAPDFADENTVRTILQRADLVKFARRLPSAEECNDAFKQTEALVQKTQGRVAASGNAPHPGNTNKDTAQ